MLADDLLVECCAPTFAGLKTGSLFSVPYSSYEEIVCDLRELNGILKRKHLRAIVLRYSGRRALIYLYRPDALRHDLKKARAADILKGMGYDVQNADQCIAKLGERIRLNRTDSFPHEVGLFLSYPAEDVDAFMKHKDEGCIFTGFWRVYGNAEKAKDTFSRFEKCIAVSRKRMEQGVGIEDLIMDA